MHIYYESLWRNCIHLNPLYASIFDIYSNDRSRECLELKKKTNIYLYSVKVFEKWKKTKRI